MECAVLLRIEHFEQRGCRVSLVIRSDLIHLIEHENRVRRAAFFDVIDDSSGQRTYICSAVSADLRLVVQTAQRDTCVLPSKCFRYALSETRLTNTRRAKQTQNRGLHRMRFFLFFAAKRQLALYRQVFDDTFFHFLQTIVVSVEHLFGVLHIVVILGIDAPRQLQKRVQIIQLGRVVRRENMHMFKAFEFFLKPLSYAFRPLFGLGAFTQLLDRLLVIIVRTKVFFDGLHLLLEEILTLPLVDLLSRTTTNIRFDGQLF